VGLYDKIYFSDRKELVSFISSIRSKCHIPSILDADDFLGELFIHFDDETYSIKTAKAFISKLLASHQPTGVTSIESIPQYEKYKKHKIIANEIICNACHNPFDSSQFYKGSLVCKSCAIKKALIYYHKTATPERKYNRPIKMIKGDSEVIFPSKQQAARLTGIHHTRIGKCLLGKAKTTGGALWAYV
jgi:hypothetical protein